MTKPSKEIADEAGKPVVIQTLSVSELWAFKRANQRRDHELVESGKVSGERMSWFAGGRARAARIFNSPY